LGVADVLLEKLLLGQPVDPAAGPYLVGDPAQPGSDFTTFAGAVPERWRTRESEAPPKQIFNPFMGDLG
jgi:hypothetical protein